MRIVILLTVVDCFEQSHSHSSTDSSTEHSCYPGADSPNILKYTETDVDGIHHASVEANQRYVEGLGRLINVFNQNITIDDNLPSFLSLKGLEATAKNCFTERHCSRCRTTYTTRWSCTPSGQQLLCEGCAIMRIKQQKRRDQRIKYTSPLQCTNSKAEKEVPVVRNGRSIVMARRKRPVASTATQSSCMKSEAR